MKVGQEPFLSKSVRIKLFTCFNHDCVGFIEHVNRPPQAYISRQVRFLI